MTYHEALQYLNSVVDLEKIDDYQYIESMKLSRILRLSEYLGNPHGDIRTIHIAGSKGKGSTAAIVQSILREAGFRVGLYTSPHLISLRERIRINDELIGEEDISRHVSRIKKYCDGLSYRELPTFFEIYTAIAFDYFRERAVDFAVFETGLGGRLDATNILTPLVSGITPISFEHIDLLGSTLSAIAREKAGIIKENVACCSGQQEEEALAVIKATARCKGARLSVVGRDIRFERVLHDDRKQVFNLFGAVHDYHLCELTLLGEHQVNNAATAVGIVEAMRGSAIVVDQEIVQRGISRAKWDGRLEVVRRSPLIVLDGAQNPSSARVLAKTIQESFKYDRLFLILGVSKDKDAEGIFEAFAPIAGRVIATKSRVKQRALDPRALKKKIERSATGEIVLAEGIEEALKEAEREAAPNDLILVTGSLYLVGEAKTTLVPEAVLS